MSSSRASTTYVSVGGLYQPKRLGVAPITRDVLHRDADGATVVEFVNRLLHVVDEAIQAFRTAPDATKNLFLGGPQLTFTANQAVQFPHLLGRPWLGFQVLSDSGVAWNGFAAHGTMDSLFLPLTAGSNAGTFSLLVW